LHIHLAGTSPLYAYQAVFSSSPDPSTVLAATSLFFWTLTLIVLLKYVGIVIRFDDNGEGEVRGYLCQQRGCTGVLGGKEQTERGRQEGLREV
jgi:hypothetical protein